jgi:hypothetical protein
MLEMLESTRRFLGRDDDLRHKVQLAGALHLSASGASGGSADGKGKKPAATFAPCGSIADWVDAPIAQLVHDAPPAEIPARKQLLLDVFKRLLDDQFRLGRTWDIRKPRGMLHTTLMKALDAGSDTSQRPRFRSRPRPLVDGTVKADTAGTTGKGTAHAHAPAPTQAPASESPRCAWSKVLLIGGATETAAAVTSKTEAPAPAPAPAVTVAATAQAVTAQAVTDATATSTTEATTAATAATDPLATFSPPWSPRWSPHWSSSSLEVGTPISGSTTPRTMWTASPVLSFTQPPARPYSPPPFNPSDDVFLQGIYDGRQHVAEIYRIVGFDDCMRGLRPRPVCSAYTRSYYEAGYADAQTYTSRSNYHHGLHESVKAMMLELR